MSAHLGPRGGGQIVSFPGTPVSQIGFDREELQRVLDLYGRMVAAGEWRDYAMDFDKNAASFSAFRRAAERPQARIEKRPAFGLGEIARNFGSDCRSASHSNW